MDQEEFKLDRRSIPENVDFQYGFNMVDPFFSAENLSEKLTRIEDRIRKINEEIATLEMERDAETLLAKHEYESAENAFPRFGGYRSFVADDSLFGDKFYYNLHKTLLGLDSDDVSEETRSKAYFFIDSFILLFFRGGGMLDLGYSIDFFRVERSFWCGRDDLYPETTDYLFFTSIANKDLRKNSKKLVRFSFYNPMKIDSLAQDSGAFFSQWRNASLGKIAVSVIDLVEDIGGNQGIPAIYSIDSARYDKTAKAFRSFNPFEVAAWLQIAIEGIDKNRFAVKNAGEQNG